MYNCIIFTLSSNHKWITFRLHWDYDPEANGPLMDQPKLQSDPNDINIKLDRKILRNKIVIEAIAHNYGPEKETVVISQFTNDTKKDPIAIYIKQLRKEQRYDATRVQTNYELNLQKQRIKKNEAKS